MTESASSSDHAEAAAAHAQAAAAAAAAAAPSIPFVIMNRMGEPLRGNIHAPAEPQGAPVLLILHGFKGFKDWGSFPHVADAFARAGFCVLRFNFSRNGVGDDPYEFTELERFRDNTYTHELDDVRDMLDAITAGALPLGGADARRIALLGHSRGGGMAILTAAQDARVKAVASWASVASFDRWGDELKRTWRERGVLEIMNTRTRQRMPLGVALLEDCERNGARLDVRAAAAAIRVPFLIVHGEQDVSVAVSEARAIFAAADPAVASLHIIPNTDHVFGAAHPWKGMPAALDAVLTLTRTWLNTVL